MKIYFGIEVVSTLFEMSKETKEKFKIIPLLPFSHIHEIKSINWYNSKERLEEEIKKYERTSKQIRKYAKKVQRKGFDKVVFFLDCYIKDEDENIDTDSIVQIKELYTIK